MSRGRYRSVPHLVTVLSAAFLGLAGCTYPFEVYVTNKSGQRITVFANDDGGAYGVGTRPLRRGETDDLGWDAECTTRWLLLAVGPRVRWPVKAGQIVYREQLELCPNDDLIIDADFQVTVECGDVSRDERSDDC